MSDALRVPDPEDGFDDATTGAKDEPANTAAQADADALIAALFREGAPVPAPAQPARGKVAPAVIDANTIDELEQRARERAEAEAAVTAVMSGVAEKVSRAAALESKGRAKPKPLKLVLLASLVLLNLYMWLGNPTWLRFKEPAAPAIEYYQDSWKMAAYLQAQRIEEYRKDRKKLPEKVEDVRHPVRGVDYARVNDHQYQLAAGSGKQRVVYDSSQPMSQWVGESIIRLGLITSGVGR